jgi:hypothetical protein
VPGVCRGGSSCQSAGAPDDAIPHIHTLEGDLTVSHGDWIATGVKGEHWAIKPDIFSASYEEIDRLQSEGEKGEEDAQPYKDALHDLVMLKAQQDIGCVPPPTKEQWLKAWAEAEELVRVEP